MQLGKKNYIHFILEKKKKKEKKVGICPNLARGKKYLEFRSERISLSI